MDIDDSGICPVTDEKKAIRALGSPWRRLVPRLALFILIGLLSLLLSLTLARQVLGIELPHTLEDIQTIAVHLEAMAAATWSDYFAVAGVFAALYLWQQAFSIPGSVLFNLLAGHLYGITAATLWTSFLTAFGATLAYGLAMLVAEPFLQLNWISRRAASMTRQMKRDKSVGIFWWLLFARLFPFTPYWFINMVSPFLGIPVSPFFWSCFLGSMPYNFICAQAGAVLGELSSTADIVSVSLVLKLLGVSFISLVPVLFGKKLKRMMKQYIGAKDNDIDDDVDEDSSNDYADDTRLLRDERQEGDDLEKGDAMELNSTTFIQNEQHHQQ
ncbi:snare associated Golgi protein-domain-containing protein [Zychaea mexicana]|uniref:snare associated Golgi protein-domain-containing protein n=1 Tax=Zychaea mexicana TaxID=64656 RepID=UPI0022FE7D85|nr:snare associated Golgi protein-domain-containing protein [Zychaea mexicana]KAI9492463.1 snare associated Golgi protein-domain-containing protein [Zychaea mexicana]